MSRYQRQKIANLFDALGHQRRILIAAEMQKAGAAGLTFGKLAKVTGMTESNLTHHVRMMKKGGLLSSRIAGRSTVLKLNRPQAAQAFEFLGLGRGDLAG